jgi:predicted DCC family thiol-disulfide oxidoreductase YuxK
MKNPNFPLTLLYDAACPVCALEMDHLRERCADDSLRFVDIAAPGFDARRHGLTLAALNAEIHGVRPDGTVLRGVAVLRLAYEAAGLGWVLRATAWPGLRPVADLAYRVFARHRQRISRAVAPLIGALRAHRARQSHERMQRCAAGACEVGVGATGTSSIDTTAPAGEEGRS